MRAAIYTRFGGPEVLEIAEVDQPVPADHELLIEVRAAEVTKTDTEIRQFQFPVNWFRLAARFTFGWRRPKRPILGGYFAGVVVDTGKDVSRFAPGDAVFGCTQLRLGANGEYLCLPENYTLSRKPDNISFEQAAAVPLGGLNALHFMNAAELQPGERLLINGAGGSIGSFALLIAKRRGVEITAVDRGDKAELLRALGADHVIDYTAEDFTRSVQSWDVIFDMVAAKNYPGCIRRLRPGGRYLIGNPRLSDMLRSVLTTRLSDKAVIFRFARETQQELDELARMLEAGEISPVIDRVYPLAEIADAHRRVQTEARLGIVVVRVKE